MINFYIKNKKILNIILVIIFSVGFFGVAKVAWAGAIDQAVTFVVGWIAILFVKLCGIILGMVIESIISITQYNEFITEPSIVEAWIIIRDICNMFFVLILLVIAFATILRVESYNVKKLLPKLLIMAVLINFSRIICGLMIDFSQVIMLTFVNAFADGGGNFIDALKVKEYVAAAKNSAKWFDGKGEDLNLTNTVVAIILAVVLMLISTITMIALLVVFLMRVVMLWIYVVLSPLAFLLSAFPGGQKYASQFWGDFTKYLINGPVLAFFIWLALITANQINPAKISFLDKDSQTITDIMGGESFMPYLISIGLLVGGLMISSQIGGIGANWGANTVKGLGSKAGGVAKKGAMGGVKLGLKGAKNVGSFGVDWASQKAGVDFNLVRGYQRLTAKMESNKKERSSKIYDKVLSTADGEKQADGKAPGYIRSKMALASTGSLAWQNFTAGKEGWSKLIQRNSKRDEKIAELIGEKDDNGEYKIGDDGKPKLGEIGKLVKEKGGYMTTAENQAYNEKIKTHSDAATENEKEMEEIKSHGTFGMINPEDADRYDILEKSRDAHREKEKKISDERDNKVINDDRIEKIDTDIKKYKETISSYNLKGIHEERALSKSDLESEGNKKISNIENPDQLVEVLREALKSGQQGLVSAITKKLTKQGNYNEFLKALELGTGRDGMIGFSKHLQEQGGFTRQTALSLVGEIGELAKNVKHFAAFGAVKIENGKYTEATQDEADAAQLSEMLKVQLQAFARDTGRLGLGEYKSGMPHTSDNWVPTRAALAMLKANPGTKGLASNIMQTGQASGAIHMGLVVNILRQNNIPDEIIKAYIARAGQKDNMDYDEMIKEMKNKI